MNFKRHVTSSGSSLSSPITAYSVVPAPWSALPPGALAGVRGAPWSVAQWPRGAAPAGRPLEAAMTQPLPFLLVVLTLLLHSPLHSSTWAISPHTLHSLPLTNFFYSCFIMLTHASISTNRRALNCLINYNSNFFFTKNVCTYMFHS